MIYDNGTIEVTDMIYRVYAMDSNYFMNNDIREDIPTIAEALQVAKELDKEYKDVFIECITVYSYSK